MQTIVPKRYKLIKIGSITLLVGAGLAVGYRFVKKPDSSSIQPNHVDDYIYIGPLVEGYDVDESERRLRKGLNYLRFAKSKNSRLRDFSLFTIAKMKDLEDYHCRRIAMLCDYQSSIKLARIKDVDLRLFSPPLNYHLRQGDIFSILNEMYKAFPESTCSSFFAMMAFRTRERLRTVESVLEDELKDKYLSKRGINLLCLQALFRYSMLGEESCRLMVNKGLLACLHTLREMFIDDFETNSLIAKLLAQLSQYQFVRKHFFSTGWIGILASWMKSEVPLELRLPAAKILFNLDNDESVLPDHLYLLHPCHIGERHHYDVVFIHGLLGSIFRTWRQYDPNLPEGSGTRCWPQDWLANDVPHLRVIAVDYHTTLFERKGNCIPEKRSLEERGETLINELIKAGLGKRPIIMVGHSMGGLLIKQMLVACAQSSDPVRKKFLDNVEGLVFYAVPHRGSELTKFPINFQKVMVPSQEIRELVKDSPRLLDLHKNFISIVSDKNIDFLSFGETDKSKVGISSVKVNALLVSAESANPGIGEFKVLDTNHFLTCKPKDPSSPSYTLVRDFIQKTIDKVRSRWPKDILKIIQSATVEKFNQLNIYSTTR